MPDVVYVERADNLFMNISAFCFPIYSSSCSLLEQLLTLKYFETGEIKTHEISHRLLFSMQYCMLLAKADFVNL